jgi:hypothetical protein
MDALSDSKRERANDWFNNTLLSRLDDKQKGANPKHLNLRRQSPHAHALRFSLHDQLPCFSRMHRE